MSNEPVAHFYPEGEGCTVFSSNFVFKYQGTKEPIPLYTHPANPKYDPETGEPLIDGYPLFSGLPPTKTLTELEILDVWVSSNFVRYAENGQIDEIFFNKFARAILRKAKEK
jgi:hypothetical protein